MVQQCKFIDDEENILGGIYCKFDNGDEYIICGCCGGIVDPSEVTVVEIFSDWINISDEIKGE